MSVNWLTVSETGGTGNKTVSVSPNVNSGTTERNAKIYIIGDNGNIVRTVSVYQAGAPVRLVRIYFNAASAVVVSYTGGTASYSQSRFMVMGEYNDGATRQIGDVTITGTSVNITTVSTALDVQSVATLTATATYSGTSATTVLTASTTIDVIQQPAPETNRITYSGTTAMEPHHNDVWGVDGTVVNLIASGYSGGQGILVFDSPVTKLFGNASNIFRPTMQNLITIDLPSSITNIGSDVFNYSTNLVAVNGLEDCDHIYFNGNTGDQFRNCSSLTTISLPANMSGQTGGLTKTMFSGCTSLVTINYAGTMAQWNALSKHSSWRQGSAIRYIQCSDGTIDLDPSSDNVIKYYAPAKLPEVSGSGNTSGLHIDQFTPPLASSGHTFENGVGTLTFNGNVTEIGYNAFNECSGMTAIELPNTIDTISGYAFSNCYALSAFTMPDNLTTLGQGVFTWCKGLTGSITIPSGVTSIPAYFITNAKIATVNLPSTIISIGANAFNGCSELSAVTIPSGVTIIDGQTFGYTNKLQDVYLPNTITEIKPYAFWSQRVNNPPSLTFHYNGTVSNWNNIRLNSNWIWSGHSSYYPISVICTDGTITL